jgi:1,4-dihydroxy-2-naphthoate octaprenyltransferase
VDRAVEHRTWFSGGSGVIPSGALRPEVALRAARISTGVTLAAAAGLAPLSLPAAALGVAALTVSWAYSMPPVRLLSTGWGEAAASIVVAGVVPAVGAAAQSGSVPDALWEVVAILIPLHLGMMLAFELPDLGGDASGGKRVLAVRIGRRGATAALGAAGIAAAVAAAALGYPWTAAVAAAGVPSMLAAARRGHHSALTTAAVATFLAAGVATAF